MSNTHYCYILKNIANDKKIYIGYTTDPKRRIRQHNQELVGGAKYTKYNKEWIMFVIIKGFPNMINALQFEWRLKHPDNKKKKNNKYASPEKIINGLQEVLQLEKWTNNSTIMNQDINLDIWILEDYYNYLSINKDNIKINIAKLETNNIINFVKFQTNNIV